MFVHSFVRRFSIFVLLGCASVVLLGQTNTTPPAPTISITWDPQPLLASLPYSRTIKTTGASSLQRTCTASGNGWKTTNQDMNLNTTIKATASPKWVGFPTQCVWTARGPGGKTLFSETIQTIEIPGLVPVYRLRRADGVYYWTTKLADANFWNSQPAPHRYVLEGVAFKAFKSADSLPNLKPVHLLVQKNGDHFYSLETPEYAFWRNKADTPFNYSGIYWYASTTPDMGALPLSRFYIPENNSHFYTASEFEKNTLLKHKPNWRYEGVSHYVWP